MINRVHEAKTTVLKGKEGEGGEQLREYNKSSWLDWTTDRDGSSADATGAESVVWIYERIKKERRNEHGKKGEKERTEEKDLGESSN